MTEPPTEKKTQGPLRALSRWLRRPGSSPQAQDVATPPPDPATPVPSVPPDHIGHYRITGTLGRGGMGIVYSARDERLQRTIALKTMASLGNDPSARQRFWREARAAAAVNHPNVCQLYEIGEDGGVLFIAMELLQGEPLSARLARGALNVAEALPIELGILDALAALHARGVVHRDLKPSNVFLTTHGVKLLDFGLARTTDLDATRTLAGGDLTRSGMVVGTPRYMAPEQATGRPGDARSDLFAAGAILFEMLAGRPAFQGRNVVEVLHATLHEQPPALTGSPAVAAVDRVIRQALAKRPADRPASAEAMAEELRSLRGVHGDDTPVLARALTRLVVLPFRVLRPDPDTDFLAFSLPDAIATTLARFTSLVVRSSAVAGKFAADAPDLPALAAAADVDRVVLGTLLRSGDELRATVQLVEAPSGTLLTSHTVLASLGDLFRLQDDIARRVVEALSLPLAGGGDATPTPESPRDAGAYELYLRGNALARRYDLLPQARELYQACLDRDPSFAPAWAQLGRCHRLIGKYLEAESDSIPRAEESFRRALQLEPRLSIAHKFAANLEADTGHATRGMSRLLQEADRHGNDAELFAGLVHACRYCGLFEQSIAAHFEARRLDPNVPTSVEQTVLMTCDLDRLLAIARPPDVAGGDDVIRIMGLAFAGRRDEAADALRALRELTRVPAFQNWADFLQAWIERRPADMAVHRRSVERLSVMQEPEAIFQEAWMLCDVGERTRGLELLQRAVAKQYYVVTTLTAGRQFDALRDDPTFQAVLAQAEAGREAARALFREHGGERLLGG